MANVRSASVLSASRCMGSPLRRRHERDPRRLNPAARDRIVRHGGIKAEQDDEGADKAFSLVQGQTEYRLQRRCHGNR